MGNPCVLHSITEAQIDDNYELLCRLWSPLVGAEEGGVSTPVTSPSNLIICLVCCSVILQFIVILSLPFLVIPDF